jgi:hypothetical protein
MSLGVFYAVFEWFWILIWFSYLGFFIIIYALLESKDFFKDADESSKSESDDGNFDMKKSESTQQLRHSNSYIEDRIYGTSSSNMNNNANNFPLKQFSSSSPLSISKARINSTSISTLENDSQFLISSTCTNNKRNHSQNNASVKCAVSDEAKKNTNNFDHLRY